MGYKISALESRDKKKLTSADINFFKGAAARGGGTAIYELYRYVPL